MSIRGVALTAISDSPDAPRKGSTKNIESARAGSLPSNANSTMPNSTVRPSATTGESSDIARLGAGRDSSRSMRVLARDIVPQPAHPLPDLLARRVGSGARGRDAPARDDDEAVADLEQLVEILAHD